MNHISSLKLVDILDASLSGVFDTMLSYRSEQKGVEEFSGLKPSAPSLGGEGQAGMFVGSVGLVGEVNGVLYLYVRSDFAYGAASKLTGLDADAVDHEIVTDVCGELTNMLAGTFKNTLADRGYSSTLTIPTVLSGEELVISSLNVNTHLRRTFLVDGRDVAVDLALGE